MATAFVLIKDYFIEKPYYTLKYENEIIRIYLDDIVYFETSDHLTSIITLSKEYHLYKPLKLILKEINSHSIIQVNRNQCINLVHVTKKKNDILVLDINTEIHIGPKYKDDVKMKWDEYDNQGGKYGI